MCLCLRKQFVLKARSQNLEKTTINFVMSVCLSACLSVRLHGTTRLILDEFSRSCVLENFPKKM